MKRNKEKKEKKANADTLANKTDIYQPPPFNQTAVKLFTIIGKIYLDNNQKRFFSVRRFKSYLALYFGFKSENINLKFNFLESVGIIKVHRRAKKGDAGGLELNIEKLLEYSDDPKVFNAWEKERAKEKQKLEDEAKEYLENVRSLEFASNLKKKLVKKDASV